MSDKHATNHPLAPTLAVAVPLEIHKLVEQGGPSDEEREAIIADGMKAMEKGDVLLYGGKKGEAAALFVQLVRAIALLSFQPGGITLFGQHYETKDVNLE